MFTVHIYRRCEGRGLRSAVGSTIRWWYRLEALLRAAAINNLIPYGLSFNLAAFCQSSTNWSEMLDLDEETLFKWVYDMKVGYLNKSLA